MNLQKLMPIWVSVLLISCANTSDQGKISGVASESEYSFDGLALSNDGSFDSIYVKPKVDFTLYDKVMLMPGDVSFKQNWAREHREDVTERDVSTIKTRLSRLVYESFKTSLAEQTRFQLVSDTGAGVLLLKPSIIKLDVHAPDVNTTSTSRKFVKSAGEASLYLEVYDSVSGEILARVIDHQEDREKGFFEWANRISNTTDAKRIIKKWTTRFNNLLNRTKP
jgi:hypothetical protein